MTSASATRVPRARMPRATCKVAQACGLCAVRIKAGQRMGKDFGSGEWMHLGCLVREINRRSRS